MSEPQALRTLQLSQLKDAAYDSIRQAITDLQVQPGSAISENWLVSQLGISKTPIRHALTRLEQEGLVETIPFKGTFAAVTRDEDARDLMDVRAVLEVSAARRIAERREPEAIAHLRNLAKEGPTSEAAGKHKDALRSIGDFHVELVALGGNPWLTRLYEALGGPLARLRSISGASASSVEDSAAEHLAIVDALEEGDGDLAAERITSHTERVLELYMSRVHGNA